tara:strand:+ start:4610 stop:5332 length:723 start_codon:yes stop_codon:yes gene_type:complete
MKIELLIGGILILIIILVIVLIVKLLKKSKTQKYKNIESETTTNFEEPSDNMKNVYNLDFEVKNSGNSQKIVVIHDRISPTIKLDMSNGNIIIDYLSSKSGSGEKMETAEYFTNVSYIEENFTHPIDNSDVGGSSDTDTSGNEDEKVICDCPIIRPGPVGGNGRLNNIMSIRSDSISFQKLNKLEIHQDLRMIDIYLNGKLLNTILLEYVPYLYPGQGILLPKTSGDIIKVKEIKFKNKS